MKNYIKNSVAQVALLALSFIHKGLAWHFVGTLLAQLSFSKLVCATCAKFVPLKNSLKALLLLNCATCATYAKQQF
ncbi:MAG: hypothetical protein LC109_00295 [Bacteroidia bacterium]|nr:hypothetical protein [Bacteroidia bacterium]